MRTCQCCGLTPAEWAWQPFGPDDEPVSTFSTLGSHYRGFPVVRVCDLCKERIQRGESVAFAFKRHAYRMHDGAVQCMPTVFVEA